MKDLIQAIRSTRRDIPNELLIKYENWKKRFFVGEVQ